MNQALLQARPPQDDRQVWTWDNQEFISFVEDNAFGVKEILDSIVSARDGLPDDHDLPDDKFLHNDFIRLLKVDDSDEPSPFEAVVADSLRRIITTDTFEAHESSIKFLNHYYVQPRQGLDSREIGPKFITMDFKEKEQAAWQQLHRGEAEAELGASQMSHS